MPRKYFISMTHCSFNPGTLLDQGFPNSVAVTFKTTIWANSESNRGQPRTKLRIVGAWNPGIRLTNAPREKTLRPTGADSEPWWIQLREDTGT